MFMGFFYGAAENSKTYRHVLEAQLCVGSLPFVRLVSWCFDRCHEGCHIRVESRSHPWLDMDYRIRCGAEGGALASVCVSACHRFSSIPESRTPTDSSIRIRTQCIILTPSRFLPSPLSRSPCPSPVLAWLRNWFGSSLRLARGAASVFVRRPRVCALEPWIEPAVPRLHDCFICTTRNIACIESALLGSGGLVCRGRGDKGVVTCALEICFALLWI